MKYIVGCFIIFLSLNLLCFSQDNWELQIDGFTGYFYDVQFINDEGWAVGKLQNSNFNQSFIYYSDYKGDYWRPQFPKTKGLLFSVHFQDRFNGWAVGQNSTIISTSNGGESWLTYNEDGPIWFRSITFSNDTTGWIVGHVYGEPIPVIFKTINTGLNWSQQRLEFNCSSLKKIFYIDSLNGWILGNYPNKMFKTADGGSSWKEYDINVKEEIHSFHFINENEGWACGGSYDRYKGSNSVILNTIDGGETWNIQDIGRNMSFNDIHFINNKYGWATASTPGNGYIFRTNNGGIIWNKEYHVKDYINALFINDNNEAWAVGGLILYSNLDTSTTGALENEINDITTYPNPAKEFITISGLDNENVKSLKIFNQLGEAINEEFYQFQGNIINIEKLPLGVYYIRIKDKIIKFIKV